MFGGGTAVGEGLSLERSQQQPPRCCAEICTEGLPSSKAIIGQPGRQSIVTGASPPKQVSARSDGDESMITANTAAPNLRPQNIGRIWCGLAFSSVIAITGFE